MGFSCGIVGLPNVGKSTIFNAITQAQVAASNYPFCTIEPNTGVVPVPDVRLDRLTQLVPTERVVPTVTQFIDIAGLVQGASQGEGLGNQFLSHIAQVQAVAHIVRCFTDENVVHVAGTVDPGRDLEVIATELALRDLAIVHAAIHRTEKLVRGGDKDAVAVLDVLRQMAVTLDAGRPAGAVQGTVPVAVAEAIRALNLLTVKPALYVANVDERDAASEHSPAIDAVRRVAETEGAPLVVICGTIEAQIAGLDDAAERSEYLKAVGLREPGLHRLIRAGHEVLGLMTFFTVGPKENRAWTVRQRATAVEAAGAVHSDMARGFIRAEVTGYDDFVACGGEAQARAAGKLRIEGRDYIVQDGDIMHFRFSV